MLEVFTVGGGDWLVNTFNAIAAWTGSGGFKALIRVCMVIGLIHALLITAMNLDWKSWLRWFIQSTLIYLVLMVPTVTVKVTDRINPSLAPATVANVPIGLAMMASFTSQVSDYLTRTAEAVFVTPTALRYSKGGFVYGARMWDKLRSFEIRDPVFKANLDGYLKQCAYYDILLGTRSLKSLSEADDLWAELGVGAATNRGMKFLTDTGAGSVDIEGKTCAEAWKLINVQWDNRINAYALPFAHAMYPSLTEAAANTKLAADVPVITQLLTGTATKRNPLLKQKSMIDAFEAAQMDFGNADADGFALQRADAQSRNAMTTAAEQGLIWIPVLNVVLTVVFYALFPVVFPLLLFPQTGIATLKGYFAGFFYLAAWGPIYVLIHSFTMDRLASQTNALAGGGVTLANWAGIEGVNQDIATMAGFLMMSVPLLALMVMRGTMSVAHSMGGLLSPVQAGADAAALERTTGSYAYGDVSYGNLNASNRQVAQWNEAASLTTGASHFGLRGDDGRMVHGYGSGRSVIDTSGAISQLPFKATMTSGYAADLRNQGQWYLSEADRIENGTSQSWSNARGTFASSVSATSQSSGSRQEQGARSSDTHNLGSNVVVEGSRGSSTREVTNNDLILREGNSRSEGNYRQQAVSASASITGTGTVGVGGSGGGGSGIGGSVSAALLGRKESGDSANANSERSATIQTTRGKDKSEETSERTSVSGSSGEVQSNGNFSQEANYSDTNRSTSKSHGTDWRRTEADERRAAASRYREIGGRLMSEASYAESHGFQVSEDMSNLIQERYWTFQQSHPEWHLPDIANPNLDYRDITRRDQAVAMVMQDLMGDLRRHRVDSLNDLAPIAGQGELTSNQSLGMPARLTVPVLAQATRYDLANAEGNNRPDGAAQPIDGASVARKLGLGLKSGARLGQMDRQLAQAMEIVASEARSLGLPKPVITSGNDSKQHAAHSAHYENRALDFRGNNISDAQGQEWASRVRSKLGVGYSVNFERFEKEPGRDHLHVALQDD